MARSLAPRAGFLLLAALFLISGCTSRALLQRAETLRPGEVRLTAAVEGGVAHDSRSTVPTATPVLDARVGVADGADVALRLWTNGTRLSTKLRLARTDGAVLSLELGAQGALGEDSSYSLGGFATLLTGIELGEHELVIAAHLAPAYGEGIASGRPISGLRYEAGVVIGIDLALGDLFHLMPEVGLLYRGGDQRDSLSSLNTDPLIVHIAIGGAFQWSP